MAWFILPRPCLADRKRKPGRQDLQLFPARAMSQSIAARNCARSARAGNCNRFRGTIVDPDGINVEVLRKSRK